MVTDGLLNETENTAKSMVKGAPITEEQIESFKALNLAVALSSPKVQETIWLVPERTGNHEFELTPEDIRILEAVTSTFGADLIEINVLENQPGYGDCR